MIDTHCHIDLYKNPHEILRECESKGIITIGMTNLPSHFEMGLPYVQNFSKIRLALGMHPLYADSHDVEFKLFIRNIERTSYIGEIGLDFSKEGFRTKDTQIKSFNKILDLIKDKKKIVSLHSRRAEEEVLLLLQQYKIKAAIFHWYSGPLGLIERIAKCNYYFSINTAMVKSKAGIEIVKKIPLTYILTESDGPFIEHKGAPVRPSDVKSVIESIAKLKNISVDEVKTEIDRNFKIVLDHIR